MSRIHTTPTWDTDDLAMRESLVEKIEREEKGRKPGTEL